MITVSVLTYQVKTTPLNPPYMIRSGVNARMDSKFPHHPLMPSEASYKKNVEAAELNMLRKTMGAAMPLKLSMERKAASKVIKTDLVFDT